LIVLRTCTNQCWYFVKEICNKEEVDYGGGEGKLGREMTRKKKLLYIPSHCLFSSTIYQYPLSSSLPFRFCCPFPSEEKINRKQPVFASVLNQIYVRSRSVSSA